jgi:hypothetical protein
LLRVFILAGSRTTADHVPPPPVTCSIVDISGETPAGSFRSPNSASPMVRAVPCSVYTLSVPLGHASNAVCSPVLRRPRSRAWGCRASLSLSPVSHRDNEAWPMQSHQQLAYGRRCRRYVAFELWTHPKQQGKSLLHPLISAQPMKMNFLPPELFKTGQITPWSSFEKS